MAGNEEQMLELPEDDDPGPFEPPSSPGLGNVRKKNGSDKFTVAEELILASLFIGKRQIYLENNMRLVNGISIQKTLAEKWSEILEKGCRKKFDTNQIMKKIESLEKGMKQNEKDTVREGTAVGDILLCHST